MLHDNPDLVYSTIVDEYKEFEKAEEQARLILGCSDTQVVDIAWLTERVRLSGLSPISPDEQINLFLYGPEQMQFVNKTHQGVSQLPSELVQYWLLLRERQVRRHLEIGTFSGTTSMLTAAYLRRCNPEVQIDLADVYPHFTFYDHVNLFLPINYHCPRTSFDFRNEPLDSVLIDADHSASWTIRDWYNVGHNARIAALHDINSEVFLGRRMRGVRGVWDHVKLTDIRPNTEWIEIGHHPTKTAWGIGVRVLR